MKFGFVGIIDGKREFVGWKDGELDPSSTSLAQLLVETLVEDEDDACLPGGPCVTASIDTDYQAWITLHSVFDRILLIEGDQPEIPGLEVPEGAIP